MSTVISTDVSSLRRDDDGCVRIGSSQVLLETLVRAFRDGASAETIVQRYPTVSLADAYAAIAYVLKHADWTDQYLAERERAAQEVRARIDAHQGDLGEIRRRIAAQRPV